jgi:hypothetical protein
VTETWEGGHSGGAKNSSERRLKPLYLGSRLRLQTALGLEQRAGWQGSTADITTQREAYEVQNSVCMQGLRRMYPAADDSIPGLGRLP